MTPERAQLIENLYAEALERKASERTTFLDKACGGDRELFREIESLLAQGAATGSFMESPAIEEFFKIVTGGFINFTQQDQDDMVAFMKLLD